MFLFCMASDETPTYYEEKAQSLAESAREKLDDAILKICSLGIPITVMIREKDALKNAECQWLFGLFLSFWVVSIVCVVFSFKVGEKGWFNFNFTKIKNDDEIRIPAAERLNVGAFWCFIFGIMSIVVYAIVNRQLF